MRVSLVYAGIAGKGFGSLKQGMDSGWISHGLASLSAYIKSQGFTDVNLIDLRALDDWDEYRAEVAARQPDVLGVTMMSVDYNPACEAVKIAKEVNPAIITVVGGAHPTAEPDSVLANPNFDYVVTAEGEITFGNLLKAIRDGKRPQERLLVGIHPMLDRLPFADRDLFLDEWRKFGYDLESPEVPFVEELPGPFVTIIAGRGCRYKCNFCKPMEDYLFGRGTRRRSVDNVLAELTYLQEKYHFKSFMFHDDCLTEDRDWVTEFCAKYKAAGFTQKFCCQSRADIISLHEDMVALMADAGLVFYFIGFESGNDRVLRFIKKGTTRARNIAAAEVCRRHGIYVWANYMLGLPTETEDEIKDTISMLKIIDPDYYSPSFFTPHPGSDLYEYANEKGLNLVTDFESYKRNPTELKIKGHDIQFLMWAMRESQRRTLPNQVKRKYRKFSKRYLRPKEWPAKVGRRMRRLTGRMATQAAR